MPRRQQKAVVIPTAKADQLQVKASTCAKHLGGDEKRTCFPPTSEALFDMERQIHSELALVEAQRGKREGEDVVDTISFRAFLLGAAKLSRGCLPQFVTALSLVDIVNR